MKSLLVLSAAFLLSACASSTKNLVIVDAVDLRCTVECQAKCDYLQELRTDKDGMASIDDALEMLVIAISALDKCEVARASCVECIDRGRSAGVIK